MTEAGTAEVRVSPNTHNQYKGVTVNRTKTIAIAVAAVLWAAVPIMSARAAQYTKQEKEAIAVVQGFYDALNARDAAGGESKMPIRPIVEKYISEKYHQNSPDLAAQGQGPESLIRMFQGMGGGAGGRAGGQPPRGDAPPAGGLPAGGPPRKAAKVVYIGAVGNTVVRASELGPPGQLGPPGLIFNMFTVENGKLVEHWDAIMGGSSRGVGGRGGAAAGPGGPPESDGPPGAGGPPPGNR